MLTLLTPPASLGILQPATLPTKIDPYFKIPIFWHSSNHTFQGIVARAYINRSFGCLSWEGLSPADNHIIAQAHLCKGFPQAATPNDHRWWVRFRFRRRSTPNAPRLGAAAAPACLAGDEASARRGQYLSRQAAGPPLGRRPQRRLAPLKAVRRSAHHRTPQTQGHGKSWLEGQPKVSVFEPLTAGVFCWPVASKLGKRYCHNLTLQSSRDLPLSSLTLTTSYNIHKTVLSASCWFYCHRHPQQVTPHWPHNACSFLQYSPGYKKPINEKIFMGLGSQICRHCLGSVAKQNRFVSHLSSLRVALTGGLSALQYVDSLHSCKKILEQRHYYLWRMNIGKEVEQTRDTYTSNLAHSSNFDGSPIPHQGASGHLGPSTWPAPQQ